ncbi:hypothetical protein RCL1_000722 [Eukaryota sp. TZLM3-RCL]
MSVFECSICLRDFTDPASLPCGHSFCRSCITKWLSSNTSCVHCRLPFNQSQLSTNFQLVHVMDELSRPKVIPSSDLTEIVFFTSTNVAEISFCKYRGQPAVLKQYKKCVNGVAFNGEKISIRQYSIVKALEFPQNLVRIFGITKDPHGIVMEQLSNSLQHLLHQKIIFSTHDAEVITKDIVSALTSLHSFNFVHRDISAGNVFIKISSSGVVLGAKLGDLDQVKQSNSSISMNFLGTAAYVAPEIMEALDTRNEKPVDVFSLGVLLFALYTSTDPSSICSEPLALMSLRVRNGCKALIDLSKIGECNITSLLTKMTSINPSERPTIEQVYSFFFHESPSAPVISSDSSGYYDPIVEVSESTVKSNQMLEPKTNYQPNNVQSTSLLSRLVSICTCGCFSSHQATVVDEEQVRREMEEKLEEEKKKLEVLRIQVKIEEERMIVEREKQIEIERQKKMRQDIERNKVYQLKQIEAEKQLAADKKRLENLEVQARLEEERKRINIQIERNLLEKKQRDQVAEQQRLLEIKRKEEENARKLAEEKRRVEQKQNEFKRNPIAFICKYPSEIFSRFGNRIKFIGETKGSCLELSNDDCLVRSTRWCHDNSFIAINHPLNGRITVNLRSTRDDGWFSSYIGYFNPHNCQDRNCDSNFLGIGPYHDGTFFYTTKGFNLVTSELSLSQSIVISFENNKVTYSTPHSGWSRSVDCVGGWVFGIVVVFQGDSWSIK